MEIQLRQISSQIAVDGKNRKGNKEKLNEAINSGIDLLKAVKFNLFD